MDEPARPRALHARRLTLLPITAAIASAALGDRAELERLVGATVPPAWPSDLRPVLPMYADPAVAAAGAAGWGPWVAIDPAQSQLVGDAGFKGPPSEAGDVELGYGTVERFRGRGYATEAAARLVDWACGQPGVSAVVAECEEDNLASRHVLARLGMEPAGRRGSLLLWRLGA